MLYNVEKKKIKVGTDCMQCKYFDKKTKKCKGIGKCCFLFDPKTQTVIDHVTHLPLKIR